MPAALAAWPAWAAWAALAAWTAMRTRPGQDDQGVRTLRRRRQLSPGAAKVARAQSARRLQYRPLRAVRMPHRERNQKAGSTFRRLRRRCARDRLRRKKCCGWPPQHEETLRLHSRADVLTLC